MAERDTRRKVTTIFAADVVGYSRMMSSNEEATLAALKDCRYAIDGLIERHEGRIFSTAGDSVMAEFPSAVEAVRCAVAVQDELRVLNRDRDSARRMDFRIGINVGDVMVDGDDLLGDGVNIASRLEGIAEPGGIAISSSAYSLVRGKLDYGFQDAGPQQVKNIAEPIQVYRLRLDGIADSVASPMPPAEVGPASQTNLSRKIIPGVLGLAVIVAAFVAVYTFKRQSQPDFVGMTVYGVSNRTGLPLMIALGANSAAKLELAINEAGATRTENGRWWRPDDERICFQFNRFSKGGDVCRVVVAGQGTLSLESGKPDVAAWSIGRGLVYPGMSVHGVSGTTGRPFVVRLAAKGEATIEIGTGEAQATRTEKGVWRTDGESGFCVQFSRFAKGRELCRVLSRAGVEVLASPRGAGETWKIRF